MNSDKAEDCRTMIDYLLGLVHEGKLKYEYVMSFNSFWIAADLFDMLSHLEGIAAGGIKIKMIDILEY
jgi:histidinol phosphatase-like PHP family hydrolase